ncbi:MAG: TetR/AcrR family transcriptional regulator [Acholeplasmatales bacterium]|nr:TetR/AcrR family transcriptional regulator [Acholeplasmatales bacterium]
MKYIDKREKTIKLIEDTYFDLYIKNEKITVSKICDIANIHRSTFYFYFEWVEDVLESIKNKMMNLLIETINSEHRLKEEYKDIQKDLRKMFKDNRKYLVPLVLEQKGGEFALKYREYLKEKFAEDIGLDYKTGNDVKNDVANCILSGLIEMQLYEISSEIIPEEYTYIIGRGIIDKGVKVTLNNDLNIKFGK